jgi:unconventional prefoldin RPB5 interactor 1
MASVKDHFLDLERHRRQLEENVEKLRKAITHWRMCHADYEELKEEVEAISGPADRADLDRICDEFEGHVIARKEAREIFGEPTVKTKAQIVGILSRRIDYVSTNVETLGKQLQDAEEKYEKANIVANPDAMDEDSGLPITDIIEELDDDDNITSSRLQRPGDSTSAIREALEKAGVDDLPETEKQLPAVVEELSDDEDTPVKDEPNGRVQEVEGQGRPETKAAPIAMDADSADPPAKKGVSFAEDTKPGHELNVQDQRYQTRDHLEQIMKEAKEQEAPLSNPVIPEDESDEDAELRREMLRYGMTDIAPIVAELEIDEGTGSEFDDDEYSLDEDDGFEDDNDDDEDEHGRTKSRVVDDKYRKRMQELEVSLGIKSSRQIEEEAEAKASAEAAGSIPEEGIARIAIQPAASNQPEPKAQPTKSSMKAGDEAARESKPRKKGVKFASALDIAPETDTGPAPASVEPQEPKEPYVDPMRSTIVERSPAAQPAAPTAGAPKKTSRFKKARTTEPTPGPAEIQLPVRHKGPAEAPARFLDQEVRTAPTGPDGKTLAGTVVERDMPSGAVEPDEFDATLLHQEAAVEYHRMRNRMIQKQGGFVAEKEEAIEYPEDEGAEGKRVSRFKAARLGRQ